MTQPDAERPPGAQLAGWLATRVRSRDVAALAALRRLNPDPRLDVHYWVAHYAPTPEEEQYYQLTAFLFARFHAGALSPHYGYGDVGAALRRIGNGLTRGPKDPGAKRLLTRITASRELPTRHLQHVVDRARSCHTAPPAWELLPNDLARWQERGRPVADAWGRSFYTPTYPNRTPK
ncbi:type I-E CRISPR-associated protein Cse2/CasB [Streptomyces hydrogenans]|uniref:type I-E CRISPR-associated protein Cse2/CasB n=1 Tax=Streptomyces hydrogenans TaxID=1873719 RepID=UPI0038063A4B